MIRWYCGHWPFNTVLCHSYLSVTMGIIIRHKSHKMIGWHLEKGTKILFCLVDIQSCDIQGNLFWWKRQRIGISGYLLHVFCRTGFDIRLLRCFARHRFVRHWINCNGFAWFCAWQGWQRWQGWQDPLLGAHVPLELNYSRGSTFHFSCWLYIHFGLFWYTLYLCIFTFNVDNVVCLFLLSMRY